jgi:3-oxoacyl-[acyl-carrier-protein] synthase II
MARVARRVVVTGLGVVSPVGNDVETFWGALRAGRSGVSLIDLFPIDKLRTDVAAIVREVPESSALSAKEREMHGRVTQMLCAAGEQAVMQAGLASLPGDAADRVGVILGTGQGPVEILERNFEKVHERGVRTVSPYFIPTAMPNAATALVSIRYGFRGPSWTMASACATAMHALIAAALLVESGDADAMVVGGGEAALYPSCLAGFGNARALARSFEGDPKRASRPYDVGRTGFVIGEGAGALVIEAEEHARARGATVLATLLGWGSSSDASHLVRPPDDGAGLALAIDRALRRAEIAPSDLGYLNPHATSTQAGDVAELRAMERALGAALRDAPVSATKSILGHLLGGAGAVETIATVCSVRDAVIHPSINLDAKDAVFAELDVATRERAMTKRIALKLSAGFGGHNAALVIGV